MLARSRHADMPETHRTEAVGSWGLILASNGGHWLLQPTAPTRLRACKCLGARTQPPAMRQSHSRSQVGRLTRLSPPQALNVDLTCYMLEWLRTEVRAVLPCRHLLCPVPSG